jgi:dTDP-4-dehydrorhamnose 3,5-epimerase
VEIRKTALAGVLLLEPTIHRDARGHLFESYRADRLAAEGIPPFVQENQSLSARDTLRGLHFQQIRPQAKLVRVLRGAVFDVAVDIRRGSPTFGRWVGQTLSAENGLQLYIPAGFAHGFLALEDPSEVLYKCSDYYSGPGDQHGIVWDDPTLAISWPCRTPLVSPKDAALERLRPEREDLPNYQT